MRGDIRNASCGLLLALDKSVHPRRKVAVLAAFDMLDLGDQAVANIPHLGNEVGNAAVLGLKRNESGLQLAEFRLQLAECGLGSFERIEASVRRGDEFEELGAAASG